MIHSIMHNVRIMQSWLLGGLWNVQPQSHFFHCIGFHWTRIYCRMSVMLSTGTCVCKRCCAANGAVALIVARRTTATCTTLQLLRTVLLQCVACCQRDVGGDCHIKISLARHVAVMCDSALMHTRVVSTSYLDARHVCVKGTHEDFVTWPKVGMQFSSTSAPHFTVLITLAHLCSSEQIISCGVFSGYVLHSSYTRHPDKKKGELQIMSMT